MRAARRPGAAARQGGHHGPARAAAPSGDHDGGRRVRRCAGDGGLGPLGPPRGISRRSTSCRRGPRATRTPLGRLSSPRTFGHNGSNCCIAWADPDRDVVYAYVTDRVRGQASAVRHQEALADAVLQELDGSSATPSSSA
ncbi:serine hydrolase [Amycolatopsis acidiphila]|uniref:Serine hydrolase n=1 Tax=Amycolatopsis acidiphila TaxID=715473 RepID=A0A558ABZ9_9PSEU|nr:serine hydrolase [Amycolatopsis acidiphila]